MSPDLVAARWDAEYREGRYAGERPVAFVDDILSIVRSHRAALAGVGLYVGCGNGRNYLPLVDAGLRLHGLDVSREALDQLMARRKDLATQLTCADFMDLEPSTPFDYLIAIQVFQHGGEGAAAAYFAKTAAMLESGGLFFLRVNSASTEIYFRHAIEGRNELGGFTARYDEGPKAGLAVHFYGSEELRALGGSRFDLLFEPREVVTRRAPPKTGSWTQWEVVWRKR